MAVVYINLEEAGNDLEREVLIAAQHEATKIVFIGEDARAADTAKGLGVECVFVPDGTAIPFGAPRVFCGRLVTAY